MKTDLYHKWLEAVRKKTDIKREWIEPSHYKDDDVYKQVTSDLLRSLHIQAVQLWQSEVGAEFWYEHRRHSKRWPFQAIQETLNQDSPKETKDRWLASTKARFGNYHSHRLCNNIVDVLRKTFPDIMHIDLFSKSS